MYIYGKNVARETLKSNRKIIEVIMSENFHDIEIKETLEKRNIPIHYEKNKKMDALAKGLHQGIILKIEDYQYASLDSVQDSSFLVLLDHLEDPHNFGAIIRTCEAAGVDAIIIPKNRSVEVNSTVMKTSAGALENMKIILVSNLVQTMKKLKKEGFWLIGTDMEGEEYTTLSYTGKIGLVIGSEGFGISALTRKECDFMARIPMHGKINSLNASVAAGIIIYEAVRQRK